jgi:molybdopterin converting factor small subunit
MNEAAPETIRVTVLLFSVLREEVGQGRVVLDLLPGATGAELLDVLSGMYEPVRRYRAHLRLAVNAEYAREAIRLAPGDEVALITPTSGG